MPIGAVIALEVQLVVITVVLVLMLVLEQRRVPRKDGGPAARDSAARRIDGTSLSQ